MIEEVEKEIWNPVVGFEGFYEVSSHGRVRSIKRLSRINSVTPERKRIMGGKILSQTKNKDGYCFVHMTAEGKSSSRPVHQLVLEAFVGKKPHGEVTRHLNSEPSCNFIWNLAWGTQKENMSDRVERGKYKSGHDHHMATIDDGLIEAVAIVQLITGLSPSLIGRAYGISHTHIYRILNGKTRGDLVESAKVRARKAMYDSFASMQYEHARDCSVPLEGQCNWDWTEGTGYPGGVGML